MKLRTIVDTNVFVSGIIFPRSNPLALLKAWERDDFRLLVAEAQIAELERVLRRPSLVHRYGIPDAIIRDFFRRLYAAERVQSSVAVPVTVRDPTDVRILAAAIGGNAQYLVSGDNDLLVLRDDPRLRPLSIVTIAEFLRVLTSSEDANRTS